MSGKAFFDTNVLVYAVAANDQRTDRAEALLAGGGVVSIQVLNEFVAVARRKFGMNWNEISEALAAFRTLCPSPVPITVDTHEDALRVAAQYGYHIYDALVAAAALQADCNTLYSEDMQHGQVIDARLTIRNPFSTET
jgi:predicted nucleic acid-binding protein